MTPIARSGDDAADPAQVLHPMTGLVGMFDILGYRSFLRSNPASRQVGLVLKAFADAPAAARDYV